MDVSLPDNDNLPSVSIIVPAHNEAGGAEKAIHSLLSIDYPELEIVLVNDRSTDGTRQIMDTMANRDPRVRVIHVDELPPGWMGKSHAM
ncbi:MAG: glycosyltransferase [Thermaerobacterales bacterium]